jgi:hypothetical protein
MWQYRAGLGGGFGEDYDEWIDIEFAINRERAEEYAREMAVDIYRSYGGLHGLLTEEDVMEDDDTISWEEAEEIVNDDIDSWITYEVREV